MVVAIRTSLEVSVAALYRPTKQPAVGCPETIAQENTVDRPEALLSASMEINLLEINPFSMEAVTKTAGRYLSAVGDQLIHTHPAHYKMQIRHHLRYR